MYYVVWDTGSKILSHIDDKAQQSDLFREKWSKAGKLKGRFPYGFLTLLAAVTEVPCFGFFLRLCLRQLSHKTGMPIRRETPMAPRPVPSAILSVVLRAVVDLISIGSG